MRDHKIDLAMCETATKGMPFDIVGLADMASWYMTRCTGLEVQLKCAEDANDQLKAGAEAEIKRLRDLITEAISDMSSITNTYNCCDTCKHAEGELECPYLHLEQCRGWEWRRADALKGE